MLRSPGSLPADRAGKPPTSSSLEDEKRVTSLLLSVAARDPRLRTNNTQTRDRVQPVTRLRNVAVILAGGTGTRVGLNIPKKLIKIAGKPIIEHTIAAMHQ